MSEKRTVTGWPALDDYDVRFHAEGKAIALLMRTPGTDGRHIPLSQCSRGEQVQCALALAMTHRYTGAPLCLDNLDSLSTTRRALVLSLLSTAGGTVFCAGADQGEDVLAACVHRMGLEVAA